MMIAISLSRLSSEELKRTYSPTFCRRSASSGLRSQALNGPLIPLRGPAMMASAIVRGGGVILSSGISGKRSPVKAQAEPANSRQTAVARTKIFMALSLIVPGSRAGLRAELLHYGRFWQGKSGDSSPPEIRRQLRPYTGSLGL